MAMPYEKDDETVPGGCRAKDVHDEMRNNPVDIGGDETTTEELMRPQTGKEVDG